METLCFHKENRKVVRDTVDAQRESLSVSSLTAVNTMTQSNSSTYTNSTSPLGIAIMF